jgi:hypothetical protein
MLCCYNHINSLVKQVCLSLKQKFLIISKKSFSDQAVEYLEFHCKGYFACSRNKF